MPLIIVFALASSLIGEFAHTHKACVIKWRTLFVTFPTLWRASPLTVFQHLKGGTYLQANNVLQALLLPYQPHPPLLTILTLSAGLCASRNRQQFWAQPSTQQLVPIFLWSTRTEKTQKQLWGGGYCSWKKMKLMKEKFEATVHEALTLCAWKSTSTLNMSWIRAQKTHVLQQPITCHCRKKLSSFTEQIVEQFLDSPGWTHRCRKQHCHFQLNLVSASLPPAHTRNLGVPVF